MQKIDYHRYAIVQFVFENKALSDFAFDLYSDNFEQITQTFMYLSNDGVLIRTAYCPTVTDIRAIYKSK